MVVMRALIQFENRSAALEIVSCNKTGVFELCQHSIYGCQPNILARLYQLTVNILGSQMAFRTFLQQLEDFQPRTRSLQTCFFKIAAFQWVSSVSNLVSA